MKYYIIAGEASGDTHAANLMKAIKNIDSSANFRIWGGDKMMSEGGLLVKHYNDLAFMGLAEVLLNIKTIINNISFCKKNILSFSPDVLILIDYPGFNLRIAEFAHKKGIKTVYYISPQIWAWHRKRVFKIKKIIDLMLVILPFEKAFYQHYNYEVTYVGHPLLDELVNEKYSPESDFLKKNNLSKKPIIALLPGSRNQEIKNMLKTMLQVVPFFPDYQFVIAGSDSHDTLMYENSQNVPVIYGQMHDLLANSKAALVTSGTASLETAIIGVPEVVCYHTSMLTYEVAKRVVKVKFISLVNLIMDKEVVKELIQYDFTIENLKNELQSLLSNREKITKMKNDFAVLKTKLGNNGASKRAADAIMKFLSKKIIINFQ